MASMVEVDGWGEIVCNFCETIDSIVGPNDSCHIKRSWRVPSAATWFFRAFYSASEGRRLVEHDPRCLVFAAIFLAGKVEENFIRSVIFLIPFPIQQQQQQQRR